MEPPWNPPYGFIDLSDPQSVALSEEHSLVEAKPQWLRFGLPWKNAPKDRRAARVASRGFVVPESVMGQT